MLFYFIAFYFNYNVFDKNKCENNVRIYICKIYCAIYFVNRYTINKSILS